MHVQTKDLAPGLRVMGWLIRSIAPSFTVEMFRKQKKMIAPMKGRHFTKKTRYEQVFINRVDGSKLRLCVYSPATPKQNVPGILWIHGGGYAIGAPEQDALFINRFIAASGAVVVAPDYTLSVDAPYPAALDDCYAALLWLRDNGAKYGMRTDQIFVGGDSAGGGLTAAISLLARDKGEVSIAFQMPLYPMIDDRPTPSNTDNDAPVWNTKSNEAGWSLYLGELYRTENVSAYAAPARCGDFRGLPPTCSYVGSVEPFYDETVAYIDNLNAAQIETHFKIFDGCFHAFDQVCYPTKVAKQARAFLMESFAYAVEHYFANQKVDNHAAWE